MDDAIPLHDEADVRALAVRIDQLGADLVEVRRVLEALRAPESPEVATLVRAHALGPLARLYDRLSAAPDPLSRGVMASGVLLVLVQYQSEEGTDRVIARARAGIADLGLAVALGMFAKPHRHRDALIAALSAPLPTGFAAAAFLDLCNGLAHRGERTSHPFDTPEGVASLTAMLEGDDPSHAHSAAAAIPFLSATSRGPLLQLALASGDADVRVEGAYAAARTGQASGLAALARAALEPGTAAMAIAYLEELGRPDLVPASARAPGATAVAELSRWLAHPSEYGAPPDEIGVEATFDLVWPPTGDRRRLDVVRFAYHREGAPPHVGRGVVGSVTFALDDSDDPAAPTTPFEVLARHCAWEVRLADGVLPEGVDDLAAGLALLLDANPELAS